MKGDGGEGLGKERNGRENKKRWGEWEEKGRRFLPKDFRRIREFGERLKRGHGHPLV